MLELAFELSVLHHSVKFWPISTFWRFGAVFSVLQCWKREKFKCNAWGHFWSMGPNSRCFGVPRISVTTLFGSTMKFPILVFFGHPYPDPTPHPESSVRQGWPALGLWGGCQQLHFPQQGWICCWPESICWPGGCFDDQDDDDDANYESWFKVICWSHHGGANQR